MSEEHYLLALSWAKKFVARGTQNELNLAGIGESTLHPDFVRNVHLAREAVGWKVRLVVTTNGVAVTREMVEAIAPAKPMIFVSNHRPEKSGPAINLFREFKLLAGTSNDPAEAAINWAGQVAWTNTAADRTCGWAKLGRVMLMADGRLTRCCLDGSGAGVIGPITDDLDRMTTGAYVLCTTCDQKVAHQATPDEFAFDARKIVPLRKEVA